MPCRFSTAFLKTISCKIPGCNTEITVLSTGEACRQRQPAQKSFENNLHIQRQVIGIYDGLVFSAVGLIGFPADILDDVINAFEDPVGKHGPRKKSVSTDSP
jgi:hypothetical protein